MNSTTIFLENVSCFGADYDCELEVTYKREEITTDCPINGAGSSTGKFMYVLDTVKKFKAQKYGEEGIEKINEQENLIVWNYCENHMIEEINIELNK